MKNLKVTSEDEEDRLSALPEGVLLHILTFLNTKYAVQTLALSKKWRTLWTLLPDLNFDSACFNKVQSFDKFIKQVLSLRDDSITINSFNINRRGVADWKLIENAVNYATSHGIQHLKLFLKNGGCDIPMCIYAAQSLRTLVLKSIDRFGYIPKPLCFLQLTNLHLQLVTFVTSDVFSSCPNLVELTLISCYCNLGTLKICAPQLTRLTISMSYWPLNYELVLSSPKLVSFNYVGYAPLALSKDNELLLLQKLRIEISSLWPEDHELHAIILMNMLQRLHNAKYVTLSMSTVELLSGVVGSIAQQPLLFGNLESLKIVVLKQRRNKKNKSISLDVPEHVMKYLLTDSPDARFVIEFVQP